MSTLITRTLGILGTCAMTVSLSGVAHSEPVAPQGSLAITSTVTTLSASAKKVPRGKRVTLIAKVTSQSGSAVTNGSVSFWAMGIGQTRWTRLGVADLSGKGVATKRIRVVKTKWYQAMLEPQGDLAKSWSSPMRVAVK